MSPMKKTTATATGMLNGIRSWSLQVFGPNSQSNGLSWWVDKSYHNSLILYIIINQHTNTKDDAPSINHSPVALPASSCSHHMIHMKSVWHPSNKMLAQGPICLNQQNTNPSTASIVKLQQYHLYQYNDPMTYPSVVLQSAISVPVKSSKKNCIIYIVWCTHLQHMSCGSTNKKNTSYNIPTTPQQ